MKRIIALLFVAILMISMLVPAFAAPTCCHGDCKGVMTGKSYGPWVNKEDVHLGGGWYWKERTVTLTCNVNRSHKMTYVESTPKVWVNFLSFYTN